MINRNICKFIEESHGEKLTTKSFVSESNRETMGKELTLEGNRIILVSQSGGDFYFDGRLTEGAKGDIIFAFLGEKFHVKPLEGCEFLYIQMVGNRCSELFKRFGISPANRRFTSNEGLVAFWREAISRAGNKNLDLITESVVLYSLSQLAEGETRRYGIAEQLIDIINEEFSDPGLSLTVLSERLGYNTKYISHTFKEKTGRGFSEYLRCVRIRQAVFLMDHGLESVKNIACFCGFDDQLYFSSVFKKVIGVSPSAYIKKAGEGKHSES